LLSYETAFREQFRRALWKFAEDGLSYAEIRFGFDNVLVIKSDDGSRTIEIPELIGILSGVVAEEVPKIRATGLSFWGVKGIYACMRSSSNEAMKWAMNMAIEMKQQYPDFICGECFDCLKTNPPKCSLEVHPLM
jgi:adenosine deaminase CECR1